jgi:hypothetical protein
MPRSREVDVRHMPVMSSKCETCPFNDDGDRHLRSAIEERVLTTASQTCHHTGAIHERPDTHLCRGARDFQLQVFYRLGFLSAPTDEAWRRKAGEL